MRAYLDGEVFSDFINRQPKQIPFGTKEDQDCWNSFWQFCKEEADLYLCNPEKINMQHQVLLNHLTSGRGETKFITKQGYDFEYKQQVNKDIPDAAFFLSEKNEQKRKRFEEYNGRLLAFQDNYYDKWKKFSLDDVETICPVRKESEQCLFYGWEQLQDYLIPFSDVVLIDNYILSDPSLIPSNIEKILIELDAATPVSYPLTIITFEGKSRLEDRKKMYEQILACKKKHQLHFDLQLVFTTRRMKEHDRNVITNYLRIKSGDSFNYFDSKGNIVTKGTEIEFQSLAEWRVRNAVEAILCGVKGAIEMLCDQFYETHVFGENKNRLLK